MTQIRTNHPYGFRSGQWAVLLAHGTFKGHSVYVVQFPDRAVDLWRIDDPAGDYEFREKA